MLPLDERLLECGAADAIAHACGVVAQVDPVRCRIARTQQQPQPAAEIGGAQQQRAGAGQFGAWFDQHYGGARRESVEKFVGAGRVERASQSRFSMGSGAQKRRVHGYLVSRKNGVRRTEARDPRTACQLAQAEAHTHRQTARRKPDWGIRRAARYFGNEFRSIEEAMIMR